jgi:hypothetical protein
MRPPSRLAPLIIAGLAALASAVAPVTAHDLRRAGAEMSAWVASDDAREEATPSPAPAPAPAPAAPAPAPAPAPADGKDTPAIRKHFEAFKDKVKVRADGDFLYVESDGLPDHRMMVGIRAWQQQVPLPQPYTGGNAWRIPLKPRLADRPVSAKTALFRGAIALAVNGVPIFNPIKNDGRTDTFLAGELDEFGGHCGRGDDYHYHIAPVHLEKVVGRGNPIGYALDGYPLYGYADADGREPADLDEFNGRTERDGYRYYSTRKYPYVNGGLRGAVTVRGDQIDPQPRAEPVRPDGRPLRGAVITGFERDGKTSTLRYELGVKTHSVRYTVNGDGSVAFVFADGDGRETRETYRSRGGDRDGPRPDDEPRERKDDRKRDDRNKDDRKKEEDRPPPRRRLGELFPPEERDRLRLTRGQERQIDELERELRERLERILTPEQRRRIEDGPPPPPRRDDDRPPPKDKDEPRAPGGGGDGPRLPWLAAHFDELDTDGDGVLTLAELKSEVEKTFAGYDRNKDGRLTRDEYEADPPPVRSALAGFVRGHAAEMSDRDGVITKESMHAAVAKMFGKADRKGAGKITKAEASQAGQKRPE